MAGVAGLSLQGSVGALEIGSLFSVFLFGIETLQTHLYFQTFRDDKLRLKSLVTGLWFLELTHTFCVAAEVYKVTVIFYGQPAKIFPFPFLGASTLLGGLIAFIVHSFFCFRCYRVLPKYWNLIGVFCFLVAFCRFIGSAVLGVQAAQAMDLAVYRRDWGWLITALLVAGAFIDITIAVSMMYYLVHKREKVFARAAQMIDKIVQYTICTGLLTSMGAVSMVIVYYSLPHTLEWLAVYTCLAKLYSNSLLAALNSRTTLRQGLSNGSSSVDPSQMRSSRRPQDPNSMVIAVEMKSTVHTVHDDPPYMNKPYGLERGQHSSG
ncbi:hypothetical protein BKA70DRAFT_1296083 [Coprinopsis sp. MPI-PUGE-AT-0042]|nr:hypothetical protein BKA70DRAFT_1296083 [Coprinopsis sp. MPI-PUGE-AT-0042]